MGWPIRMNTLCAKNFLPAILRMIGVDCAVLENELSANRANPASPTRAKVLVAAYVCTYQPPIGFQFSFSSIVQSMIRASLFSERIPPPK